MQNPFRGAHFVSVLTATTVARAAASRVALGSVRTRTSPARMGREGCGGAAWWATVLEGRRVEPRLRTRKDWGIVDKDIVGVIDAHYPGSLQERGGARPEG